MATFPEVHSRRPQLTRPQAEPTEAEGPSQQRPWPSLSAKGEGQESQKGVKKLILWVVFPIQKKMIFMKTRMTPDYWGTSLFGEDTSKDRKICWKFQHLLQRQIE